ncbi:MAG: hypothetical protein MZV63_03840 [Marinilabiliales bacterium]|nr:hypothetical protein [Marinilabiliales bacterium]
MRQGTGPAHRFLLVDKNGRMWGWRNVATKEEITTKGSSSGLQRDRLLRHPGAVSLNI